MFGGEERGVDSIIDIAKTLPMFFLLGVKFWLRWLCVRGSCEFGDDQNSKFLILARQAFGLVFLD